MGRVDPALRNWVYGFGTAATFFSIALGNAAMILGTFYAGITFMLYDQKADQDIKKFFVRYLKV